MGNTDSNAIRNVQPSTITPPPKRTEEDIAREVAESSKAFYYETKQEEKKKWELRKKNELRNEYISVKQK